MFSCKSLFREVLLVYPHKQTHHYKAVELLHPEQYPLIHFSIVHFTLLPRLPEDLHCSRLCGVQGVSPSSILHPLLLPTLKLIHPPFPRGLTCLLRSSIIRVIWIFFLPIVPVFFFLSSFLRTLCFLRSPSSSSFSSLFCSFFIFFSAFYLFQSTQRFQHSYLQERRKGSRGGERKSIKWNEIWQNTEREREKKNNKSGIMAATREGEERQRICQQCCENRCVFHCRYHANQFLHFFFPGTDYERRQRCQDLTSFTESLTVFWKCR